MALILYIDTTTDDARVGISELGNMRDELSNNVQKEHGSFLHVAIDKVCKKNGIHLTAIDAIAVLIGPGSYTGIRIGLSAAKGLSYALQKPLIALNTLEVMAYSAKKQPDEWCCSMIDARRMEVFYALFNAQLECVVAPTTMLLTTHSFADFLQKQPIRFVGNGISKWKPLVDERQAIFGSATHDISGISALSYAHFLQNNFADLRNLEACYAKAFFDTRK